MYNHLLAKSNPQLSLEQHIKDGLAIWEQLQVTFPAAPKILDKENLWKLLRLAIITHDAGKGHCEFQKVLQGNKETLWHSQRHELFSLPFSNALQIDERDKQLILRVVAGHHKSYTKLRAFIEPNYKENTDEYEREFAKVEVKNVKALIVSFGDIMLNEIFPLHPGSVINSFFKEKKKENITDHFLLLLMIGAFKHCDHLSSAFISELRKLESHHFHFLKAMQTKLQAKNLDLHYHQKQAAHTLGNVILTAPTGSGKTETSLLWLKYQLETTGQGRTFYILPFTASINAMFERLGSEEKGVGKDLVGMLHGKLDAYLYDMFQDDDDTTTQKEQIKQIKEQFKTLQTPLKVLTPFQLLKHIFGLNGFEKGIFEWVGGHFIFDEIHAYEPEIIAQIVVLLEYVTQKLSAKVFIMTATLPTFLKNLLQNAISQHIEIRAESALYKQFKRHQLILQEGLLASTLHLVKKDLEENKNVLVVCNTVQQAQQVYQQFSKDYDALLLHGSFAAKDRTAIEKQLQKALPQLLVGTQAIEVSLDIDYDVIYTEPAPLDALIQRFGRVNRKQEKTPCPCIIFTERNKTDRFIYSDDIIKKTLEVFQDITSKNNGVIQEIELQDYIDQVYPAFDEKAQEQYDTVYKNLKNFVKRLIPFEPSEEGEEDYYKQFDGVKVLPLFYEKKFKSLINKFDFIGGEQLKVQIRKGRFSQFLGTPFLEKNQINLPIHNGNKFIEIKYYVIKKKYRQDLGLMISEDEVLEEIEYEFDLIV